MSVHQIEMSATRFVATGSLVGRTAVLLTSPDGLDFEERTLTVLDSESDESLVSFGCDQLRNFENQIDLAGAVGHLGALLYSTDGVD